MVLIVEDDRSTLALLAQLLRQAGFRVATASDPMQGFTCAVRERPAAVISDLRMPAGGGETLLRRLQTSNRTSDIPVVIVSASVGPEDRERLLGSGVAAVLAKPVDGPSLLAAIAAAIGREGPGS